MADEDVKPIAPRQAWRGLQSLSGSVAPVLQPVIAKRGFAAASLMSAWPEIVGPRYANCTLPEHIRYERGSAESAGTLTIRVDGPMALYLQHELGELMERINAYLGRHAIRQIKIIQRPVDRRPRPGPRQLPPLGEETRAALDVALAGIEDESLKAALLRLAQGVLGHPAGASGSQ